MHPMDSVKGVKFGLGAGVRDFLAIKMPNLKYERMHTYVINETMVAVVSKIGATIGDVPPKFSEFPMFPGIEPNRVKGKSFSAMALDIHILDKGKIQRTWHVEYWTTSKFVAITIMIYLAVAILLCLDDCVCSCAVPVLTMCILLSIFF